MHEAIALCRVSTAEQKAEGHSLQRQGENVIKAAKELAVEIAGTWSIDQSSRAGKNLKRKDLAEMLAYCREHKRVKYLIVDEVDRFMRDIKYFYHFEAEFEKLGVTVWYASQPELNSNNMMAKLNKLFLVFRAEASNDERQSKTLNGLKGRVKAGYYPFPIPQGYQKSNVPGLFEPDPIRFPLLQTAFREVLSGSFTPPEALKRLTQNGYLTPQQKELPTDDFLDMLRSPYYAGALRIKKWSEEYWNNHALHKPMISLDEFESLQLILNGRKHGYQRKVHNPEFPLSNLIECECSKRFVGCFHRNGKGKEWPKYRCRGCGKHYLRKDVHEDLTTLLDGIEMLEEDKAELLQSLATVWQREQAGELRRVVQLQRHIATLKAQKDQLVRALGTNPEMIEDIKESVQSLKLDIAKAENDLAEANKIEDDLVEFTEFAINYVSNLKDEWWSLDHEDRVRCKQLLFFDEIYVNYDKKVYTPQISPIFRFKANKKDPALDAESFMVDLTDVIWRQLEHELEFIRQLVSSSVSSEPTTCGPYFL